MANNQGKQCAHPGCTCQAKENSKYCSTYCEGSGDTLEVTCNCGHPNCATARV